MPRQTKTPAQRATEEVDVLTRRAKREQAAVERHDQAAKEARAAHAATVALLEHAKRHPALQGAPGQAGGQERADMAGAE